MNQSLQSRQEIRLCGSSDDDGSYDLSMQIGALFIILTVSASACAFPLIVVKTPRLRIDTNFLFIVRNVGTGVLLATSFVHLLPTAFTSLTDLCLPSFFNKDYPALAGAIALASVFVITCVEMLLSPGRKCCAIVAGDIEGSITCAANTAESVGESMNRGPLPGRKKPARSNSNGREFAKAVQRMHEPRNQILIEENTTDQEQEKEKIETESSLTQRQKRQKAAIQCILLEIGILFHSVFIGMSLGVSMGSNLTILLIAITFHQLFEGLALGSRIAANMPWGESKWRKAQPWLMCLAYGCTTPLGQALGISTHNLYDPGSKEGLLVVGIMNAISAGLLTFTSLVDLLSEDFLTDESWRTLRGTRRVVAFSLVFLGAFLMSLIGAWA